MQTNNIVNIKIDSVIGIVLGICLTLILCVNVSLLAETQGKVSDDEIAKKMGPPFYSGNILPNPREAKYGQEIYELYDGVTGTIFCKPMFEYFGPARELLMRLWNKRINAYKRQFKVDKWKVCDKVQPMLILFTLVNDANAKYLIDCYDLHNKIGELKEQGYVLEIRKRGILCAGKDNEGLVNGLASLLQLIHIKDGKLVVRQASVFDYPTFVRRYVTDYSIPPNTFFDWLALQKINGFSSGYAYLIDWRGVKDANTIASLKRVGDYVRKYRTLHFMPQIHIGPRVKNRPALDQGDPKDIDKLVKTVADVMQWTQADEVMILFDDVRPVLTMPKEKQKFKSLGQANGYVLDLVYKRMQEISPGSKLFFCPPPYQGLKYVRKWKPGVKYYKERMQYMKDVHSWNKNIVCVWTGPVTESRIITKKDILEYKKLIGEDRKLLYWDNTWQYHQPLRNFHSQYPKDFVTYCAYRHSFVFINATLPIGRFFAVTANDYYWNPEGFDADRCWRTAVAQFMGKKAVAVAERFYRLRGDGYYCYFARDVDIGKLKAILEELKRVSWTNEIPDYCWAVYKNICKIQKKKVGSK